MKRTVLPALLLVFSLCLPRLLGAPMPAAAGDRLQSKVSPWVLAAAADGGQTDFLVVLAEQADLSAAYALPTRQARGRLVHATLWETAQRTQAPLRAWLDVQGVSYRSFYIVNLLHVQDGDRALLAALAARPDVARIEANPRVYNRLPRSTNEVAPLASRAVEWNIQQVNADHVWALGYTGQGVVVGGQDTGYDWDHPALQNQYRGWDGASANHDYNWHDAIHSGGGVCGADSPEPCDDHSHGTHTMGIVVGDDGASHQIGMAPGARWIGCRNMDQGYGTPATYLECFEFFLAPYPVNGDPSQGEPDLAPDVTNNSWSCPPTEGCAWDTLQAAVEAQRAAGIMTVVSAGNSGPGCSSVSAPPALYDASYTVGSTDSNDNLAYSSSRGPVTEDGSNRLKPDISAPGVSVRSSVPGNGYGSKSGTSMAAPHVAGAAALLWSAVPGLTNDVAATEAYLNANTLPISSTLCSSAGVPNNLYGWGRLDVLTAVQDALDDAGLLTGRVSESSSGNPVAGAQIWASRSPTMTASWTGDAAGLYQAYMISDTYTLTATAGGYLPQTFSGVVVEAGLTTTLYISLCQQGQGAGVAHAPPEPRIEETVTFTGTVAAGTPPIAYSWAFGDDALDSGPVVTHAYAVDGPYTVVLTATNCDGAAVITTSHVVTVTGWPAIAVHPPALTATLGRGRTITRTLTISNEGRGDLTWNLMDTLSVPWLDYAPLSGTVPPAQSRDATITFDSSDLIGGVYTTVLQIASNDFDAPQINVDVTLNVWPYAIYLPIVINAAG